MKYPGDISPEAYAAMEEGYEQGRADGVAEQLARNADAVAEAERRVRQAVWDYCEMSAKMAEENIGNPYAVGIATGYRDIQDKLGPALGKGGGT
jgi:hypothetical protein